MNNIVLKSSNVARRFFGLGAKESALFIDHELMVRENKERFGSSYERATLWYSLIHKLPVKKFTDDDYRICYHQYNLFKALEEMTVEVELADGTTKNVVSIGEQYIEKTFAVMQKIFGVNDEAKSDEDKLDFIKICLDKFKRQTQRETLHKASIRIIKMSFSDVQNNGQGWVFDSRNATNSNSGMRWILSSEDGISRLLSEIGREQVILNLNTSDIEENAEDEEKNRKAKEDIFLNGITDIATGKHYLCSAPSASSTRHVDFPFVKANDPEEIYQIWCEITGFANIDELVANIGSRNADGSISMVFAKVKARIAQNGANSLNTGLTATERIRSRLRNAKVVFVPDCHGTVNVPYKKITEIGVLCMEKPDGSKIEERVE